MDVGNVVCKGFGTNFYFDVMLFHRVDYTQDRISIEFGGLAESPTRQTKVSLVRKEWRTLQFNLHTFNPASSDQVAREDLNQMALT